MIEHDAQLPVRSLSESRPVLASTILPGSHPDTVPTKRPNTDTSGPIVSPNLGLPIFDKKTENKVRSHLYQLVHVVLISVLCFGFRTMLMMVTSHLSKKNSTRLICLRTRAKPHALRRRESVNLEMS